MGIKFKHEGDFRDTEKFLERAEKLRLENILDGCGEWGVAALSDATPVDTGVTAASWGYIIESSKGGYTISWTNSNTNQGFSIAIGQQYGHLTGTGGWVEGVDYINPAMEAVFEKIATKVWEEVCDL